MEYPHNRPYTADDLVRIITLLRDPVNGCPWDKVQTHTSIRMNFLEEAYEAVDALDLDDPVLMCEELGDVLMQVAFHTCMEQETGRFTWEQVCDGVCQKLIERHPNIFGTQPGYEGITDWDALKNKEKGRRTLADDLESVPRAMPALMRAAKLQKRAARHGAALQGADAAALADAAENLQTAQPASAQAEQAVGELLFAAANLARQAGVDYLPCSSHKQWFMLYRTFPRFKLFIYLSFQILHISILLIFNAKIMQTSAMKACFLIAECCLFYAKIALLSE